MVLKNVEFFILESFFFLIIINIKIVCIGIGLDCIWVYYENEKIKLIMGKNYRYMYRKICYLSIYVGFI